ncbi:MAG: putative lipid II flippase FtsW [Burkholderiaceae bacterium]|nr:putative lipid II flippase FtsW [Burkholderiaceae bacterium]
MKLALPAFLSRAADAAAESQVGQRSRMLEYDQALVWVTLLLLLTGIVMVYSASIGLPDSPKYANYKNHHFVLRQAMFVTVGLFFGLLAFRVRVEQWERWTPLLFLAALLLMMFVLVPGIGKGVNGARRWIGFGGFSLQPSEVMKLMMVFYAADFTVRKQQYMHSLTKGFLPMAIAAAACGGLLMLQPDLGAFGVIVCIAMGILFLGGFNIIWFGGMLGVLASVFFAIILISPWRYERMVAYLNPWDQTNALGKAFQLTHSLIAFGRGELFGVGLGGSVEKLHYLPEAHTDFLLAVIGEELGLIGVLVVIALFYWIVRRAFDIGRQAIAAEKFFAGLVAKGIGIWIGIQVFINMGVNLGLLPTKGLTLPLMSYGGSGIAINCIGLAILLRIDYENRVMMRGGRV